MIICLFWGCILLLKFFKMLKLYVYLYIFVEIVWGLYLNKMVFFSIIMLGLLGEMNLMEEKVGLFFILFVKNLEFENFLIKMMKLIVLILIKMFLRILIILFFGVVKKFLKCLFWICMCVNVSVCLYICFFWILVFVNCINCVGSWSWMFFFVLLLICFFFVLNFFLNFKVFKGVNFYKFLKYFLFLKSLLIKFLNWVFIMVLF